MITQVQQTFAREPTVRQGNICWPTTIPLPPRRVVVFLTQSSYGLDADATDNCRWPTELDIPTSWPPSRGGFRLPKVLFTTPGRRFPVAVTVPLGHLTPCIASGTPCLRLCVPYRPGSSVASGGRTGPLRLPPHEHRFYADRRPLWGRLACGRYRASLGKPCDLPANPSRTTDRATPYIWTSRSLARSSLPDSQWVHLHYVRRLWLGLPSDPPLCRRHP